MKYIIASEPLKVGLSNILGWTVPCIQQVGQSYFVPISFCASTLRQTTVDTNYVVSMIF